MTRKRIWDGTPVRCLFLAIVFSLLFPGLSRGQMSQEGVNFIERSAEASNNFSLNGKYFSRGVDLKAIRSKALAYAQNMQAVVRSTDGALYLGGLYITLEQYNDARNLLAQHLQFFPNNISAILLMGEVFNAEKKFDDALEWFGMAIKKAPQSTEGYLGKMKANEGRRNFGEAKRLGMQILSMDPRNVAAIIRLGNLYLNEAKYSEAMKYFSLATWHPECRLGMGLAYFATGNQKAARPLLVESFYSVQLTEPLQIALINLSTQEIARLKLEITRGKLDPRVLENKKNRLAFLFQAVGSCDETSDFIKSLLVNNPNFDQILRIAGLMAMTGNFEEAGRYYEMAAQGSPRPRVTRLAAADCYIVARKFPQAETILQDLRKQKAGFDIDQRYASMFMSQGKKAAAQKILFHGGTYYEKMAAQYGNSKELLLNAVDCYLDGKMYSHARRVLEKIARPKTSIDADMRYAHLFFEERNFDRAIEIYDLYPLNINMQVAKGYAYLYSKRKLQARQTFSGILAKYPDYKSARDGLASIIYLKEWDIFEVYSHQTFGALQDPRRLIGSLLRYNNEGEDRTVVTLAHVHTDVYNLTPGNADLNENMFGLRLFYKFENDWAVQVHGLHFSNDDPFSNKDSAFGGSVLYLPKNHWSFGVEGNGSKYTGIQAYQVNPWVQYRFDENLKLDVEGSFINVTGSALRASQPKNYSSINGTLTIKPTRRLTAGIGVWGGTRKLSVDSTSLYAYNTLDLYKSQGQGFFTYDLKKWWKLFARYSLSTMVSEWQSAFNEVTGTATYNPKYTVKLISSGMDVFF